MNPTGMNPDTNISSHPRSPAADVSERAINQPRPTSTNSHNEKANNATTAGPATRSAKPPSKNNNVISFTLNWICVVLTVAATIVFGIWAPLSYRATADGNRDNNEVQSSMMQQVMTANSIASSALRSASVQSTVLAGMQSRLDAMGQLALVDFCRTQTAVPACSEYASVVALPSLISYLALPTTAHSVFPSSTASTSAVPTSATSNAANTSRLPVEAVLGIVFGILTILGLVAGCFVWRNHKRRVAMVYVE